MKFLKLPEHNMILGPAPGDEETVQAITCLREPGRFTVAIELEAQDLENVMNGSPLRIQILGNSFAPMAIWTEKPELKRT